MKRLMQIVLGVVAVVAAGSYALWHYAANMMITEIDKLIQSEHRFADAEYSYDVETYGYPSMVGVALKNYSATITDETKTLALDISIEGESHYYTTLLDVLTAPGTFRTEGSNLKVSATTRSLTEDAKIKDGEGAFRVDLGRVEGAGQFGDVQKLNANLQDVDFYVLLDAEKEERLFTLDKVNYVGSANADAFDMLHADGRVHIEGATFIDPAQKHSMAFKQIIVDMGYTNMPKTAATSLRDTIEAMQASGNVKPVKEALKVYIQEMAKKASGISINAIQIETEGLNIEAGGTASVAEDEMLNAAFTLKLEADNKIKNVLPAYAFEQLTITPFGKQLLTGKAEMEFTARIENGYAVINGMPLLSVPPLTQLVALMPDNVNVGEPEEHLQGSYLPPEEHTDDLLEHFKKEEEMLKANKDGEESRDVVQPEAQ